MFATAPNEPKFPVTVQMCSFEYDKLDIIELFMDIVTVFFIQFDRINMVSLIKFAFILGLSID